MDLMPKPAFDLTKHCLNSLALAVDIPLNFAYTIKLAVGTASSLSEVTTDTTVMPKNITYPTDVKLLYKGIQKIVDFAHTQNIPLRQSYKRVAKQSFILANRYAHAHQMRRHRRESKRLKTYLGRLYREMGQGPI